MASALALLAADYASRIDAIVNNHPAHEHAARIGSLRSEQAAAVRALKVQMKAEARVQRKALLATFQAQQGAARKTAFRAAAGEVTGVGDTPTRPRNRTRSVRPQRLKR